MKNCLRYKKPGVIPNPLLTVFMPTEDGVQNLVEIVTRLTPSGENPDWEKAEFEVSLNTETQTHYIHERIIDDNLPVHSGA